MKPIELLYNHKLKRTSSREDIIRILMSANKGLSENEIREQLEGNYDRTTFYRSFKILEKHKLIHKIVVDNQIVKYALNNSIADKNEHAHFYCNECHTVQCLESVHLKEIQLPNGYTESETKIIIKGICAICK